MSRRALVAVTLLSFAVTVTLLWWFGAARPPRIAQQGSPVPSDERVEMELRDERASETGTRKLERAPTREEALGSVKHPEPDPAADPQPGESARALDALALEAWKQGDLSRAVELFQQAVVADPDDHVPRSHYGRLLILMNDYDAAGVELEHAAALAPEDPQVWLDLQSLYERNQLLELTTEARARADALAGGRAITQDENGLYRIEGAASFP